MGVNRVSFCFEIFDPDIFREVCPGKHREYGLQRYLEAIRYCAALGSKGPLSEPWVTNGEIIVGLEPPESSIKAIEWITSVGAIPTVCVFRPLRRHRLTRTSPPPRTEDDRPGLRAALRSVHGARAADWLRTRHPREPGDAPGRGALAPSRRYPLTELKLKVVAKALRFHLERRWRRMGA